MMNIAVFVSGGGTNLQAIIDSINSGYLNNIKIGIVIASKDKIYAIKRAKKAGIPVKIISKNSYASFTDYDNSIIKATAEARPDLIVLAGYLSLLSPEFLKLYNNRIINIHPSLIPAFCGKNMYGIAPHIAALSKGVKVSGATVHFVNEGYDEGPIIIQKAVDVREDDTPETLQQRIMTEAEQVILPRAIKLFSEGAIVIEGNKARIRAIDSIN